MQIHRRCRGRLRAATVLTLLATGCTPPKAQVDAVDPEARARRDAEVVERDAGAEHDAARPADVDGGAEPDTSAPSPPATRDAGDAPDAASPAETPVERRPVIEVLHALDVPLDTAVADVRVSADGSRVAFRLAPRPGARGGELYLVGPDFDRPVARLVGREATTFEWNESGELLAWQRSNGAPRGAADTELVVYDDETRTETVLAVLPSYLIEPGQGRVRITPDGAVVHADAARGLRLYERATGLDRELAALSAQAPILSASGDRLAYIAGNTQGPLFVYDRTNGATTRVAEQAVADPGNRFTQDGSHLAAFTFFHSEARMALLDLATGERLETAIGGRHFALSPDGARAYYLRDGDRSLPYGSLFEWDFALGREAMIDDYVRGPVIFADGGARVFYRDNWEYHIVGGSPSDLRVWLPAEQRSQNVAETAFAFGLVDATGSAALVIHQDEVTDCTATLYEVGGARRQSLPGCWLLGPTTDQGMLVLGAYADQVYTLYRGHLWDEDRSTLATGVLQAERSPDGHTLAYVTGDAGSLRIVAVDVATGAETALVEGAEEAAVRAVTDALVVTTARVDTAWRLEIRRTALSAGGP